MDNQIYFYNHCDEDYCDLGSAEFECPKCESLNIQYGEIWHSRYTGFSTLALENCQGCGLELMAVAKIDGIFAEEK